MRKVPSSLFIPLDGVVEAPDTFVRSARSEGCDPLTAEMIAEQDAVLLGRTTDDDWPVFWLQSPTEPVAICITTTPKYIMSETVQSIDRHQSKLIAGNLGDEIAALKRQPGKMISVHGSSSLVQS